MLLQLIKSKLFGRTENRVQDDSVLSKDVAAAPERVEELRRLWNARDPSKWRASSASYIEFGREAVALGHAALAFDILSEGLSVFAGNAEMRYLAALALARGGSTGRAARILQDLLNEPSIETKLYSECLSLAGRLAKDRWSKLQDGAERKAAGDQAQSHYQRAFDMCREYFPGINAATMNVLTGREEVGRRLAHEVHEICIKSLKGTGDYWLYATLGEASLILEDKDEARDWYDKAAKLAGSQFGHIATMRRQLMLLTSKRPQAQEMLRVLTVPRVAVFAGHMIDSADRGKPRFPASIGADVAAAIEKAIVDNEIGIGYCSAACGADILFAERMLARGAEINIVLPFERKDFLHTSVTFAGNDWGERFERVLASAASVSYCVDDNHLGDDVLFAHAGVLLQGMAVLRAEHLETEPLMLVVVEPELRFKVGGTQMNLGVWQRKGRHAVVLNLSEIRAIAQMQGTPFAKPSESSTSAQSEAADPPGGTLRGQRQIKTMLFADMAGFDKLREHQTPRFFARFLKAVASEIDASAARPAFGNTWGDGLYLVFHEVEEGADFGLRLRDAIAKIDWRGAGLPKDMNIRIGMHTGPVFRMMDPIIKQENFFGSHVTRAARMKSIATPGSIYATKQMAAALAASGDKRFACEHLDPVSLAKDWETDKIFRLRRATESE